jgi:lysozyme
LLVGPDVSEYQGLIDWPHVSYSGGELAFAIAKASEGHTLTDPQFARNWNGIRERGLVRGAYHFARPHLDGTVEAAATAEAEHMLSVLAGAGGLHAGDLPPALDLETSVGLSSAQIYEWVATWVKVVEAHVGARPLIYTGFFWKDYLSDYTSAWGCPLWLAQYSTAPQLPRAWSRWTLWQFTSGARVGGIDTDCDMSYFNGSHTELRSLCLGGANAEPDRHGRGDHAGDQGHGHAGDGGRHSGHDPTPPAWPGRPLRRGSHGADVQAWQRRMRERGFVQMRVDGVYGPQSVEYCRWLEQYLQRPPTGVVDQAMWTATWQAP